MERKPDGMEEMSLKAGEDSCGWGVAGLLSNERGRGTSVFFFQG